MVKIKVELEVEIPNGEYCLGCEYGKYVASDFAICTLFDSIVLRKQDALPKRCDKCKQAEVKNGKYNC